MTRPVGLPKRGISPPPGCDSHSRLNAPPTRNACLHHGARCIHRGLTVGAVQSAKSRMRSLPATPAVLTIFVDAHCRLEAVMDQGQVAGASAHGDEGDEVQAGRGFGQALVVMDQSLAARHPGEAALDHPPPRRQDEAAPSCRFAACPSGGWQHAGPTSAARGGPPVGSVGLGRAPRAVGSDSRQAIRPRSSAGHGSRGVAGRLASPATVGSADHPSHPARAATRGLSKAMSFLAAWRRPSAAPRPNLGQRRQARRDQRPLSVGPIGRVGLAGRRQPKKLGSRSPFSP